MRESVGLFMPTQYDYDFVRWFGTRLLYLCPGQSYPLKWHETRSIRLIEVSLSQDQPVMHNIHYRPSPSQHSFIFRDNLPGTLVFRISGFCDLKGELSVFAGNNRQSDLNA